MKKEKWQDKVKKFFGEIMKKIKNFYETRRKLAFGITAAAVILIILLSVVLGSTTKKTNSVSYISMKVTKGTITQTIDAVGNIQAVPSAVLNWKTSGIVGTINVKIGNQVKEGDVLASLVDSSVDSSILTAQNDLLAAKLALNTLKAGNMQFQTATQNLAVAQKAYEKALAKRDWWVVTGVSDEAIDVARAKYYDSKAAFWNAQQVYETLALAAKQTTQQYKNQPTATSSPTSTPVESANMTAGQPANTSSSDISSLTNDAVISSASTTSQSTDTLSAAYDAMKAAELTYNKASRNLNYLIGNGYGNNNVVEQEFLAFDVAKATLAEAESTWQLYKDSSPYIKAAEAKVQALQNTVDSSRIIAPFDGTVTDLLANKGQTVSSGTEAAQMDNINNLEITFTVSEVDVNKLAVGQEAEITFAAVNGKTYKGVVEQVGKAGTSASGVVEFYATIKVINADAVVKPGFSANISIIINKVENVLLVPNSAVMTDSTTGKTYVLTNVNGKTTPIAVEIGLKDDTFTEIKSGNLKEGETVLISLSSSGSDTASNRALFGIIGGGGFGGGEPPRNPSQTGSSSGSSNRNQQGN